jgi:hypothetical protein
MVVQRQLLVVFPVHATQQRCLDLGAHLIHFIFLTQSLEVGCIEFLVCLGFPQLDLDLDHEDPCVFFLQRLMQQSAVHPHASPNGAGWQRRLQLAWSAVRMSEA